MSSASQIDFSKYTKNEKKPQARHPSGFRGPSPDVGKKTQWKKGQSGNPGGKPKDDIPARLARRIFADNEEALVAAFTRALLKGNAHTFKELADRAYGKVKRRTSLLAKSP